MLRYKSILHKIVTAIQNKQFKIKHLTQKYNWSPVLLEHSMPKYFVTRTLFIFKKFKL